MTTNIATVTSTAALSFPRAASWWRQADQGVPRNENTLEKLIYLDIERERERERELAALWPVFEVSTLTSS